MYYKNQWCGHFLLLFILLQVTSTLGGSSTLRCYHCDNSETAACDSPPVTAILGSIECRVPPSIIDPRDNQSLTDFVLSRADNGQFSGLPLISEILLREASRNRELTDGNYTFYCGKLLLSSGDNKSLQRRCVPVKKDISNVCDFISKELDDRLRLTSCNLCDTDQCNSSSSIVLSIILTITTFSLTLLRVS